MKVTPFDGLTRFMVQSDVNPDNEYLVELEHHAGCGKCSCDHFTYRLEPLLCTPEGLKESKTNPSKFQCKHIRCCRRILGQELVDTLTKANNKTKN